MEVIIQQLDNEYYLNFCSKFLSRKLSAKTPHWQFPIVDTWPENMHKNNRVSFIYYAKSNNNLPNVSVLGTFSRLYEPIELMPVAFQGNDTGFWATTLIIPIGSIHHYQFLINGTPILDPLNPQTVELPTKKVWSCFFTDFCTRPISFEVWELGLLKRLISHILPFKTKEADNFFERYYDGLDRNARLSTREGFYRLDDTVGEVNAIDKLVAKQERHRLVDYKICLTLIDELLRQRNRFQEPSSLPKQYFVDLYNEMKSDNVPGWDYSRYNSPKFFLQILRRHAVIGAFGHPRNGGNIGAAGWQYLSERYQDDAGNTLFDWRAAIEKPLGWNQEYMG